MIYAPYGAMRGAFSLRAVRREVAAYYGISAERMARAGGGAEYQEAREAMAWKLNKECSFTIRGVARALKISPSTAGAWVNSHNARIQEFRAALADHARAKEAGVAFS